MEACNEERAVHDPFLGTESAVPQSRYLAYGYVDLKI
jgi:hypothetical protein